MIEEFCVVEEGEECNVTTRNGGNEAILLLFALGNSILIHLKVTLYSSFSSSDAIAFAF